MLEAVSYHAVIRYLERVLCLPVSDWLREIGDVAEHIKAELCCERAGLPVSAVRLAMLTDPVLKAMRSRHCQKTKVITRDAIFVIMQGRIVTVLSPDMQAYRKKKYKAYKSRQMEEV